MLTRILCVCLLPHLISASQVCAVCQYRWGVLLSLTFEPQATHFRAAQRLFTLYMVHLSFAILVFSVVGLFRVWRDGQEDWLDESEPLGGSKWQAKAFTRSSWTFFSVVELVSPA